VHNTSRAKYCYFRGLARACVTGFSNGDWQGMSFLEAKESWHAFCVREHTKDGQHPGPLTSRPTIPSPATATARTSTLTTYRTAARTTTPPTTAAPVFNARRSTTSAVASTASSTGASTTAAATASPASASRKSAATGTSPRPLSCWYCTHHVLGQRLSYFNPADLVGGVYYPRAGQACVSPHCPSRSSCSGCSEVDPLVDMMNGLNVAEADLLEPFRRTYFSWCYHVYHTE
jgi:hypothetical protein